MNLKFRLLDIGITLLIFISLLVGSMTAITYFSNEGIFNAEIVYVNNIKTPYSVILNIENLVDEDLYFDVEIVHLKQNLVVSQEYFDCNDFCEVKLEFSRAFFDEYGIFIRTNYAGNYYERELNFILEKIETQNFVQMQNIFLYEQRNSLNLTGTLNLEFPSEVILEVIPKNLPDRKESFNHVCEENICPFSLELKKDIVFGEYDLRVYLPNDVIYRSFLISNKLGKEVVVPVNVSLNNTLKLNSDVDRVKVLDLFGNIRTVDVVNGTIDSSGIIGVQEDLIGENIRIEKTIKPRLESVGSLSEVVLEEVDKKNFVNENIYSGEEDSFENNLVIREGISDYFEDSFISLNGDVNPVVYEDERIYLRQGLSSIEINDSLNSSSNKLVPGVYKKEKVVRYKDGREEIFEKYFAYGLISINTLKPLYLQDEVAEMLIVVLDRWGYLVDDALIDLYITKPNGTKFLLSSNNGDIFLTENSGVYSTAFLSDEIGEYKLFAQVEVDGFIVDIESFYNVVDYYEFDILRDVPVTIDPWEGPFRNDFQIIPRFVYYGQYDFTETFSSDFEIIETDADKIQLINDSYYLTWKNLNGISSGYYIAQTPLVTPYLYYLGESYVDYNEGFSRFYENRSWLFAIDPAARVCGFESPCICGAACSGGNEPGSGTIDACSDGDTQYEWTNDIRVTNLDGDYFGVGDTIEICVDFNCDIGFGGDRALISYKDGSSGWVNANVIFQTGTTGQGTACVGLQTYCVTRTLNNYVGVHHVRGSTVYQGNANRVCEQPFYRDHDDLEFEVLDKVAPNLVSWNLNNGTNVGNNLNVIRGSLIESIAQWNLPLQQGDIRHNSIGSNQVYDVDSFSNNQTNYIFDTSDISLFPNIGSVVIDRIRANDLYFNLTGTSVGSRTFNIFGQTEINQSYLVPNVGYAPLNSQIGCQVTDLNVADISYSGVNVDFYLDATYLGSNTTNSTGWAIFNFVENTVGNYNVTCEVVDQIGINILATPFSLAQRELFVRLDGTDITIPVIDNIVISSNLFSVGGVTTISAEVTDDVLVGDVNLFVTLPDTTQVSFPMVNTMGDIYSFTFSDTLQVGNYRYYIRAEDNSSNPAFSSTRNFQTVGVSSFIGIQSANSQFKLGQPANLNNYIKVDDVDSTLFQEEGDVRFIFYDFNSGLQGWTFGGTRSDWQRGVPSGSFTNQCDLGQCIATSLTGNYRSNSNQWAQSPLIDFTGRSNIRVNYWRMLQVQDGLTTDRAFFEGSSNNGGSWNVYFQDSLIGAGATTYTLNAGTTTIFPTELEGSSQSRFRFRLTSDGSTQYNGWAVDSVNISFNPRVDWTKGWNEITSNFGVDVTKLTAIRVGLNITSYDATGSNGAGSNSPDIEVQFFNGTDYSTSYFCNLDSSLSYPYYCEITIKNIDEYLVPWQDLTQRNVRFRAINMDNGDNIEWTDVKREYITPSIVENNGIGQMTAYLLQQFRNSTGGVVETLYFQPISLNPGEARQLSDFWTYNIAGDFQLGIYQAYVALTDASGNVLINEDDSSLIEDFYEFEINSLIIQLLNPQRDSIKNESFLANISLDTSTFGFGGWCGYSLNENSNITMSNPSSNYLESNLENLEDGLNNIIFYCNDSDGDFVNSGIVNFNVSQNPRIQFVGPTLPTSSVVVDPWYEINTSIEDSSLNRINVDFGSENFDLLDDSLVLNMGANNFASLGESSSFIYDSSFFRNHGTFRGDASFSSFGRNGGSFQFDGTNDWVEIEDNDSLDSMNQFSFEAWIYDSSTDTQPRGIAAKRVSQSSPNYSWTIFRWNSREIFFDVGATGDRHSALGYTLPSNEWVHLIVTFDGTADSNERKKFYINGELVSTRPSVETFIPRSVSTPMTIGILNPSYGSSWEGFIDEVKIYNRVLDEEEARLRFNSNVVQTSFSDWFAYVNLTLLKNDIYNYRVCAFDIIDNQNCTEFRTIEINKPLPSIIIDSPLNGFKYSSSEIVWANSTTTLPVVWSAVEINNNGTLYEQNNISFVDWNLNLGLFDNGQYNLTFYANDSIGNQVNNSHVFYVFADKHVRATKKIGLTGSLRENQIFEIENFGRWENYSLYNVLNTPWTLNDPLNLFEVSSFSQGLLLRRNLSISSLSNVSFNISADILVNQNYKNNFLFGLD